MNLFEKLFAPASPTANETLPIRKIALLGVTICNGGTHVAQTLRENKIAVIAYKLPQELADKAKSLGVKLTDTKEDVISFFGNERVIIWLLLPEKILDAELDLWLKLAPKESILIDGGRADFHLAKMRAKKVLQAGSFYLDVGTSCTIYTEPNKFSMMVGGDKKSFEAMETVFNTLTFPEGAYHHFGECGAGHFVKSIHERIESEIKIAIYEGFKATKEGPYGDVDSASVAKVWQHHSISKSWLQAMAADDGQPTLATSTDSVEETAFRQAAFAAGAASEKDGEPLIVAQEFPTSTDKALQQVAFTGGPGLLRATVDLDDSASYYLCVKTRLDQSKLVDCLTDPDQFKFMPSSMELLAIYGVAIEEATALPIGLPERSDRHYFQVQAASNQRRWDQIKKDKSVSLVWNKTGPDLSDAVFTLYVALPAAG